jgi:hypothetical protein
MNTALQSRPTWNDELMESMRQVGDPLADQAVGELVATEKVQAVNTMMRTLVENDDLPLEAMPPVIQDYLTQSAELPTWADPERIQRGEQFFWRYGPSIIANLFCYSLPFCYCAQKGVQVLALTTRLYTNPIRRVTETAQMIVDVMRRGGLTAAGTGIRSAQKVRLMHAGVRHQINAHPQFWNPDWDIPINQEDMAGTLMSFSWGCIDGLQKMGFDFNREEAEDFLHCWKVVGHILGVLPEMLPADMTDAELMVHSIQRRQYAACPEGEFMTRALVEMMQYHLPGNIFDGIPAAFIRYLIGDTHADLLNVDRHDLLEVGLIPLKVLGRAADIALDSSIAIRHIAEFFSHKLIEAILLINRGGNRVTFHIPTDLRQTWSINWLS